jgi:hypothetical protein
MAIVVRPELCDPVDFHKARREGCDVYVTGRLPGSVRAHSIRELENGEIVQVYLDEGKYIMGSAYRKVPPCVKTFGGEKFPLVQGSGCVFVDIGAGNLREVFIGKNLDLGQRSYGLPPLEYDR